MNFGFFVCYNSDKRRVRLFLLIWRPCLKPFALSIGQLWWWLFYLEREIEAKNWFEFYYWLFFGLVFDEFTGNVTLLFSSGHLFHVFITLSHQFLMDVMMMHLYVDWKNTGQTFNYESLLQHLILTCIYLYCIEFLK